MTFRARIGAAMALGGILPLLLLGALSYVTGRRELGETVGRLQAQSARELARGCERLVGDAVANLRLAAGYIPFGELTPAERAQALAIPYRQLADVSALALLDERGEALAPPVREANPEDRPELAGREAVSDEDLDLFAGRVPFDAARASGAAVGPPYLSSRGRPRVAVAVGVPGSPGWILAAELSLGELQARLDALAGDDARALLVDPAGAVLARGGEGSAPSAAEAALLSEGLGAAAERVRPVARPDGEWLAAFAPVARLGWGILVAEPGRRAFRAADRVRDLTLLWGALAVLLTVGLGAVLSRSLTRPIARLSAVAGAATGGDYAPAPEVEGDDELGAFGRAFNHMIGEIRRRDAEIRGWNEELQRRVDQRTAELREAQDQILRTRRLAALGSLGAGVAHEINNPLTSIIGLLTLLKRDLGEGPAAASAATALEEARRVSKIVSGLRQLALSEQQQAGRRFAPAGAVAAALEGCAGQLQAAGVALQTDLAPGLPEVLGDPLQIGQLVTHLVQNALAAMPEGGELRVGLRAVEGEAVKLTVADTGKGIAAAHRERIFDPFFSTKDSAGQLGMGLSICHALVEAHHGKISVESAEGRGSTFTVLLPAAPPAAHLA